MHIQILQLCILTLHRRKDRGLAQRQDASYRAFGLSPNYRCPVTEMRSCWHRNEPDGPRQAQAETIRIGTQSSSVKANHMGVPKGCHSLF